ncbi:MAG TPA: nicotinate phosphoribosyltransferase [Coriobacteriia bacterium]|nr:nicotinate phosphoribosyltransferase [Coriobacteriia bacterium]
MIEKRALLTDLYQLTMAQAYLRSGIAGKEACFYIHFRENPFKGGYALSCGLEQIVEFVESYGFSDEDCEYVRSIEDATGHALFSDDFIDTLGGLRLSLDVDAAPEGSLIFAGEPVLRVMGPVMQCQLVETAILNIFNFQTLVATKASRICQVAKGPVAEFGLRRAQGPAGGLLASRAAYVGGCSSTSNVEAGKVFGLPVSGTHAHSWVMAHDSELEAFRSFAREFPTNSTLLVDTYNVAGGVKNAITVAREMEERGAELSAIRIDSGDLVWLSCMAREMLDDAGLDYVKIAASNDLDEYTIQSLNEQGAAIDMWGVGTKLATAWEQPALSGVYKLSATRNPGDDRWTAQLKISEQTAKTTLPGILAVRRYFDADGVYVGDMVYDEQLLPERDLIIDPNDELRRKDLSGFGYFSLLEPCVRGGRSVLPAKSVADIRNHALSDLARLHATNRRFLNPHTYPVGLDRALLDQRDALIRKARLID